MPDSVAGQLPDWMRTAAEGITLAWMGVMSKLTHRWAQQAKRAAEMTAVKVQLEDHERRIGDVEKKVDRYHRENINRSMESEQRIVDEIQDARRDLEAKIAYSQRGRASGSS